MPIKKALLILLLIAVVGFIFVFTVYYYKTVLSVDLYKTNISTERNENNEVLIEKKEEKKITTATATPPDFTKNPPIKNEDEAGKVLEKIQATTDGKTQGYNSMSEFDEDRARLLEYMNK